MIISLDEIEDPNFDNPSDNNIRSEGTRKNEFTNPGSSIRSM